jgi:cellulose biosynthesis protein BcsQ
MITTVFSGNSRIEKSILAANLAALRARNHRHVLLVDADTQKHIFVWYVQRGTRIVSKLHLPVLPIVGASLYSELERFGSRCQDIVIDAGIMDEADTQTALIASRTVVVPICAQPEDEDAADMIVASIERARMFNPQLRVLLVVLDGQDAAPSNGGSIARSLAARLPSSTIARTVVHDNANVYTAFRQGLTIFEAQPADKLAAAELESLGGEVYGLLQHSQPGTAAEIRNAIGALDRWRQSSRHQA